ncbi:hypothetical protein CBS101457_006214 [Exobasidium rhododendri]|nr:hypothetical protein CBS101457_006214 [Exobasidium rhododendri]
MAYSHEFDPSYGPYTGEDGTEYWNPSTLPFNMFGPSMVENHEPASRKEQQQQQQHWNMKSDSGWSTRNKAKERLRDVRHDDKKSKSESGDDDGIERLDKAESLKKRRRRRSRDLYTDDEERTSRVNGKNRSPRERSIHSDARFYDSRSRGGRKYRGSGSDDTDREDPQGKRRGNDCGDDSRSGSIPREKGFDTSGRQKRHKERDSYTLRNGSDEDDRASGYDNIDRLVERSKMRRWGSSRMRSDRKTYDGEREVNDVARGEDRRASRSRSRDREWSTSDARWRRRSGKETPSDERNTHTEQRREYQRSHSSTEEHREREYIARKRGQGSVAEGGRRERHARQISRERVDDRNGGKDDQSPRISSERGRGNGDNAFDRSPRHTREARRGDTDNKKYEVKYYQTSGINSDRLPEGRSLETSTREASHHGPQKHRLRSPKEEDLKEATSADFKKSETTVPSDAMQAAMEAALGLTPGSYKESGEAVSEDKVYAWESSHALPALQRARPDEVYEQIAQVGEGTYGQVFKARADKTGIIVALKKIRMESEKDGFPITAMREIKLLQGLRHENVVRLHEMMLSKNSIYMVFEYLEHDLNGILSQPLIQFEPAHLKSLASQLLSGLAYLHRNSILHRDLKGSNLLLNSEGTLKLADFGLARRYTKERSGRKDAVDYTNRVVTLWYRPPELLFGETCYNDAIDVWGAGCIFIELFTRKPIFQGNDEIHQVQLLLESLGPITKQEWPEVETLPWYNLVRPASDQEGQEEVEVVNSNGGGESRSLRVEQDPSTTRQRLRDLFASRMSSDALDVASALLRYNPVRRKSAASALRMDYFTRSLPRPEKPRKLLESVRGEWHELESRQARRGLLPPPFATPNQMQPSSTVHSTVEAMTAANEMGPPRSLSEMSA